MKLEALKDTSGRKSLVFSMFSSLMTLLSPRIPLLISIITYGLKKTMAHPIFQAYHQHQFSVNALAGIIGDRLIDLSVKAP